MTGITLSACLSLFLYFGILLIYNFFPLSSMIMFGMVLVFSLIFWMNIKYDHMLDLNDVFSKTISFDMKSRNGFAGFFVRFLRPLNPYIGLSVTVLVLVLVLWGVPASIIYLLVYPGPPDKLLKVIVLCMSTGTCLLFFYYNRDAFPSMKDKLMFIAGVLCSTAAYMNIF